MEATITFARRGGEVARASLRPGATTVGSAPGCDLRLDAPEVAPAHARITLGPDGCFVVDLGAAGGVFLNTVRLPARAQRQLRDGDMLRIGPFFLRVALAAAEPAPAPTPAPPPRPRPRAARPRPDEQGESILLPYLPAPYQEDDFTRRFLLIFESILAPLERTIDGIHHTFDPRTAPEELLPWLSSWVGLSLSDRWTSEQRRELVRSAAELFRWRGTRRGLAELVRIYAGAEPRVDEPGHAPPGAEPLPPHTFRVTLDVPDPDSVDEALLRQIIEVQRPAHTAYVLEIRRAAGEVAWSTPDSK